MRAWVFFCVLAIASNVGARVHAMGSDPEKLRLTYQAEAYRAWPVMFSFTFNGLPNAAPESVRCCIADGGAPGSGSGAGITLLYKGARPDIELEVLWVEVHTDRAFRASLSFSTDEITGWSGGSVPVTLSFRPGGELVLYADGPALAATRTGSDVALRNGADLGAMLTAPGLGRAHVRSDYIALRRVCGTVDPDPPAPFTSGQSAFAPSVMKKVNADRALPLPDPACKGDP